MRNKDFIEKILEAGAFIVFSALVLNVTYQVVTRFAFPSLSAVWTEEASRFLFIYAVVFAAPLAMKKREYVNVDIFLEILPQKVRTGLEILINAGSAVLFVFVFLRGIDFAKIGVGQTSATLGIPMTIAYSSIAITSFFIAIYGIYNFVDHIRSLGNRGDIS